MNQLAPDAAGSLPGHNRPPLVSVDELTLEYAPLLERAAELEAKAALLPEFVELGDDATQGQIQDAIKEIDKESKGVETHREGTGAPLLEAKRIVDGFFKAIADPKSGRKGRLDLIRARLASTATDFLRRTDAKVRADREAAARLLRQQEDAQRAAAAKAAEDAAKLAARNRPAAAAEKETLASALNHGANATAASAIAAEEAANEKPADMARTRGQASLGTLTEYWDFTITDFSAIEPDAIWAYISRPEKEKAIAAYMKANAPKEPPSTPWNPLRGINFFRTTRGSFR